MFYLSNVKNEKNGENENHELQLIHKTTKKATRTTELPSRTKNKSRSKHPCNGSATLKRLWFFLVVSCIFVSVSESRVNAGSKSKNIKNKGKSGEGKKGNIRVEGDSGEVSNGFCGNKKFQASKKNVGFGSYNAEAQLIDTLLCDYNPEARPVSTFSESIQVEFELALKQIISLDIKNQHLTTAAWMYFTWRDAFLKWKPSDWNGVTEIRMGIDRIWRPDILLYNSVSPNFDSSFPSHAVLNYTGHVRWIPPAILESSCQVDVQYFPFDEQHCSMSFAPWSYNEQKMNVTTNENGGNLEYFARNGEWNVMAFTVDRKVVDYGQEGRYIQINYVLHIKRYNKFGLINFILPCSIVCVLALLVFKLPPDSGEKIGLSITVLLTLVVFLEILGDETPATPDSAPTPIVASFFVCTMLMVMCSCIMACVTLYFHHRSIPLQEQMGKKFAYVFLHLMPMIMRITPPGCEQPPEWFSMYRPSQKKFGSKQRANYHEVKKEVLLIESNKMESELLLSSSPSTENIQRTNKLILIYNYLET